MDEEYFTKRFVECVKTPQAERDGQDVDYVCHVLKNLIEFSGYDPPTLRSISQRLSFEVYEEDSILYRIGDPISCWYYVLSGSVMISNNYYYPSGSSFGQCIITNIRDDQCSILERTELLRIDYTEEELKRAVKLASMSQLSLSTSSQDPSRPISSKITSGSVGAPPLPVLQALQAPPPPRQRKVKKLNSIEARTEASGLDLLNLASAEDRHIRSRSEERYFTFDSSDVLKSMSQDNLMKQQGPTFSEVAVTRRRHHDLDHRHRFSAPPGPDRYSAGVGIRDSLGSMDYLSESQMDSDDEESAQSETSSSPSMDGVLEVLSKPPVDRSEEDIDRVMDILQYIPVFTNMTSNIRKALFKALMAQSIENENTVIIDNGEEVARWYVVLNGSLRLIREREGDRTFQVGDSFGVSQSLKILPHRGKLVTATRDCTLCYVSSEEYGRILVQGEENMKREEEEGRVVAVLEKRAINAHREGYFIVQATPERLITQLLVESVDDSFHKDFLLTYRTFLDSPQPVLEKLKDAWHEAMPDLRDRITVIMLNWVSSHFPDFEGHENMTDFLEWFEAVLLEDGKVAEKRALDRSRSLHARVRYIEMDRAGTNSPLDFEVVGGLEYGSEIFVASVKSESMPDRAGLLMGDQIMEINDVRCSKKDLKQVQSILKKNFKLSLKVRSNLPEFKLFMADPPKPRAIQYSLSKAPNMHLPMTRTKSDRHPDQDTRSRSFSHSSPFRISRAPASPKAKRKHTPKIFKQPLTVGKNQLQKLRRLRIKTGSSSTSLEGDGASGPLKAKPMIKARKLSTENLAEGKDKPSGPVRASSMEDIPSFTSRNTPLTAAGRIVDAVVKLYMPDHTYKYLDISPTTAIAELIARGVKEFYPDKFSLSPPDEFCICMVTVQSRNGPIRNSVLPNHMSDLANFIGLESRYYLKERQFHGTLVQDEEAEHIFRESKQWESLLNLVPKQVAEELTKVDSEIFCSIDSSEYIADLWRNPDHLTKENLNKFEGIPNNEMYWVVTTIVSETKAEMRAKIIKQYIKISKWCKELKNYNTMFHILSGLNHGLVQRLRSTWERVPHKHKRTMEDLTGFMNPFHNMAKYRELQRATQPPFIPLFPIIKKDLTFLFDGNESRVEGLVNFEKLRMLSQHIRNICKFCEMPMMPEPPQVDLGQLGVLKSIHHSIRLRSRHPAALATLTENALKKVYHHHRMTKMVRKHLSKKHVILEEDLLEKIADSTDRMVQLRKNPPSPLNKGKRISGTKKEYRKSGGSIHVGVSISPSPTTGSFGSDTAVPADLASERTPPHSPLRKLSLPIMPSASAEGGSASPPASPESLNSYANTNGTAQCPQ